MLRLVTLSLLLIVPPLHAETEQYDVAVIGATPSGIAAALRCARRGYSVLLTDHLPSPGGMMSNGLLQWDALSAVRRAPIYNEFIARAVAYYGKKYGEGSSFQKLATLDGNRYPMASVEPHVFEKIASEMISEEKNITLLLNTYAASAEVSDRAITSIVLSPMEGSPGGKRTVSATVFIDATYEGDLAAAAKVPYRVGREAASEFNEPHAGKIFTNIIGKKSPQVAVEGKLAIKPYSSAMGKVDPDSPQTADGAIQAYNYRPVLSKNPETRILLTEEPEGYDRENYLNFKRRYFGAGGPMNGLTSFNAPILPGENHSYPEASWPERKKIFLRHKLFAIGLIWFLQNDESVPENERKANKVWGLAKNEWPDNGHLPYDMYVREARRIVGRTTYTEQDNSEAPGLGRAPIAPDSVAITDWYMDSHSCTLDSRPGFDYDGKLILTEESRPGMIPYRALLPEDLDNLLVPVCISATHVAWGAVRLEPVWTELGESAGFAASLSLENKTLPGTINSNFLIRTLAKERVMLAFFNDIDMENPAPWIPAIQWAATRGFFAGYNAYPDQPVVGFVGEAWTKTFSDLVTGDLDPHARALAFNKADRSDTTPVTARQFADSLKSVWKSEESPHPIDYALTTLALPSEEPISRANACLLMFQSTSKLSPTTTK